MATSQQESVFFPQMTASTDFHGSVDTMEVHFVSYPKQAHYYSTQMDHREICARRFLPSTPSIIQSISRTQFHFFIFFGDRNSNDLYVTLRCEKKMSRIYRASVEDSWRSPFDWRSDCICTGIFMLFLYHGNKCVACCRWFICRRRVHFYRGGKNGTKRRA